MLRKDKRVKYYSDTCTRETLFALLQFFSQATEMNYRDFWDKIQQGASSHAI